MAMMTRRGQWNAMFLLIAIVIAGAAPLFATAVSGVADWVVQEKVLETRPPTRATTVADYLQEDYLPDIVRWSVYEATSKQAQNGGAQGWSTGRIPPESSVKQRLAATIKQTIERRYLGGQFDRSICRFDPGEYDVSITSPTATVDGTQGVRVRVNANTPTSVTCWVEGANTTVLMAPPQRHFSKNNRYFSLYRSAKTIMQTASTRLSNRVKDRYVREVQSQCGATKQEALQKAKSKAEQAAADAVQQTFERTVSSTLSLPQVSPTRTVADTTSRTATANGYQPEQRDCNCRTLQDGSTVCDSRWVDVNATAFPQRTELFLDLEDTAATLPTSTGDTSLVFTVPGYLHRFS